MNLDFHERSVKMEILPFAEITQGTMSVARVKEVKKTTQTISKLYIILSARAFLLEQPPNKNI
ncbi:hypothetical protein T09_6257 [Trichinella sp. T9]|nr:hypothetical protein T09_6257 [Trichinella sp. T9]